MLNIDDYPRYPPHCPGCMSQLDPFARPHEIQQVEVKVRVDGKETEIFAFRCLTWDEQDRKLDPYERQRNKASIRNASPA